MKLNCSCAGVQLTHSYDPAMGANVVDLSTAISQSLKREERLISDYSSSKWQIIRKKRFGWDMKNLPG